MYAEVRGSLRDRGGRRRIGLRTSTVDGTIRSIILWRPVGRRWKGGVLVRGCMGGCYFERGAWSGVVVLKGVLGWVLLF